MEHNKLSLACASSIQRVCIIGAGAAGLAALQAFKNEFHFRNVTCYEKNSDVAGVWKYGTRNNPMYDSLRTNLPKEVMAFSNHFPFRDDLPSFMHHSDVYEYLTSFAKENRLTDSIQFSTNVVSAKFEYFLEENKYCWKIDYEKKITNSAKEATEIGSCYYDALVVANGHFSMPYCPFIPGQKNFEGIMRHSYDYKTPEELLQGRVKKCLVVGGKSSGTDIAREIAINLYAEYKSEIKSADDSVAVYVSVRGQRYDSAVACHASKSANDDDSYVSLLHLYPEIRCIRPDGCIEMVNGEVLANVDCILLCTGYCYHFPFFHLADTHDFVEDSQEESNVKEFDEVDVSLFSHLRVSNRSVRHLFQHFLFNENPTLSFIGLPHTVVPFPLFYLQARYLANIYSTGLVHSSNLDGEKIFSFESPVLKSKESRNNWVEQHEQSVGENDKSYHDLGPKMWPYMHFLHEMSNSESYLSKKYLQTIEKIYNIVSSSRPKQIGYPDDYRKNSFKDFST